MAQSYHHSNRAISSSNHVSMDTKRLQDDCLTSINTAIGCSTAELWGEQTSSTSPGHEGPLNFLSCTERVIALQPWNGWVGPYNPVYVQLNFPVVEFALGMSGARLGRVPNRVHTRSLTLKSYHPKPKIGFPAIICKGLCETSGVYLGLPVRWLDQVKTYASHGDCTMVEKETP